MTSKHLVAALAFAAACSAAATARLYPAVVTAPGAIAVKPDDDFLIALASNPGTGYSWIVVDSDRKIVSLEGSAYRAPSVAMPGAGGEQIFSFDAVHTGTATLEFNYRRPWEKNVKPAKTVRVTVNVAP